MSDIGTRLREIRIQKGLTQSQLAEKLQCSDKTISRYEKNENLDKVYDFIKICECLDEVNYIITGKKYSNGKEITQQDQQIISAYHNLTDSDRRVVDYILNMEAVEPATIYRFPVFKQEAAAGIGRLDMKDAYGMENFIVDEVPDEAVFAMRIKGNSMYDESTGQIKEGAVVLVNPKDEVYEDKIVIASVDGEVICKRYTTVDDHVEFKSDNQLSQKENKDSRNYGVCNVVGVVLGVIEDEKFIHVK